jgi:hypothetical protein
MSESADGDKVTWTAQTIVELSLRCVCPHGHEHRRRLQMDPTTWDDHEQRDLILSDERGRFAADVNTCVTT